MNITELFEELHANPELSMHEEKTKRILIDFLTKHTTMQIFDMGVWFYACHFECDTYENIAFRADMDAICNDSGCAFHGCGHDGHCATLCRLAIELESVHVGKNVYFIFQPGEENGKGAQIIADHLTRLNISRIYGFHNIPGYAQNTVLMRSGTFACASKGMTLVFWGKQSHAAYPESGVNPVFAIMELASKWEELCDKSNYKGLAMATIVNVSVGKQDAFGVNAGYGELSVTLRAERECDLELLEKRIISEVKAICEERHIKYDCRFCDFFPETNNREDEFLRVKGRLDENGIAYKLLDEPMRWSEDFGHYLKRTNGLFFGVGAGEDHPDLHTESFSYNLNLIEYTARVLKMLL